MKRGLLLGLIRGLLAIVFLIAGIAKLMDPLAFADGIASFRLLPTTLINSVAVGLPIFEIATAGLLLSAKYKCEGALLSVILTTAFLVFYGWAFAQGIEVKCHCFGSWGRFEVTTLQGVVRSFILVALSAVLYCGGPKSKFSSE